MKKTILSILLVLAMLFTLSAPVRESIVGGRCRRVDLGVVRPEGMLLLPVYQQWCI